MLQGPPGVQNPLKMEHDWTRPAILDWPKVRTNKAFPLFLNVAECAQKCTQQTSKTQKFPNISQHKKRAEILIYRESRLGV
jgi:hypothetical protein